MWGPNAGTPVLDSREYVLPALPWTPHPDLCWRPLRDEPSRFFSVCREEMLVAAPWATEALPSEIERHRSEIQLDTRSRETSGTTKLAQPPTPLVFIGSVWRGNSNNFLAFLKGCAAANVTVHRYGVFYDPGMTPLQPFLDNGTFVNFGPMNSSINASTLLQQSPFGIAIQGATHLGKEI